MDGKTRLVHSCILYDIHVVKPNVLHTTGEVLPCCETLPNLQEVVQSSDVDLTFVTNGS